MRAPGASPGEGELSGTVFTYQGDGSEGLQPWTTIAPASVGAGEADHFGAALATSDFDGDGNDDLAVGAPGAAPGEGENSGTVLTYRKDGSKGLQPWTTIAPASVAAGEADRFGSAVATGDFDGDGYDDLAVGAPSSEGENSGTVFTYRGDGSEGLQPWTTIAPASVAEREGDRFGAALATGDFDSDGNDDLAVGAPGAAPGEGENSGTVLTYRGDGSEGLQPWTTIAPASVGAGEADHFGAALAMGDFDGDGNDDLAAGAPGAAPGSGENSGTVSTYRGDGSEGLNPWASTWQSSLGVNEEGDRFGFALATGDFDGDGRDDLAVGAPGESPGEGDKSGYVFTFQGIEDALMTWRGLHQER